MSLLGLDTCTAAAAACVLRDDGEAFEVVPDPSALARPPAHARELMPAVASVMEAAGVDWAGLDAIEAHGAPVLPLIDAKRGEVFAALWADGRRLWEPFAARPQELVERVRQAGLTPLAAGDGSLRFRAVLEQVGIEVAPVDSGAHVVRALQVCRLAAGAPDVQPEAVLPDYLRAPDAKPQ